MVNEFDLILTTVCDVEVILPQIGSIRLLRGKEYQLLNADMDVVNSIRRMFVNTGVKVELNKVSKHPFFEFDYREAGSVKNIKEVVTNKQTNQVEDPLEKIGNFELPSGKYKGKKLKELTDDNLKNIYHFSKTETVKAAIDAYFALKRNR